MKLVVFGCNNPTGAYFLRNCNGLLYETWGRNRPSGNIEMKHIYCDLCCKSPKGLPDIEGVLVSFAPIWLLADFIERVIVWDSERLAGIKGIIACSSSSFETKRFAFSREDQELSTKLERAHCILVRRSMEMKIPCVVLAPTLIYGACDQFIDKNVSQLIRLMRLLPFIVIPTRSGERQPIHASQLAECAIRQAIRIQEGHWRMDDSHIISLGGDEILNYENMLIRLQDSLKSEDCAKKCRIVRIPKRIFLVVVGLILPFNPRFGEALLRIFANLSGFKKIHEFTGSMPESFPVQPLTTHL